MPADNTSADESNGKLWHWSHAMQMIVADSAKKHSAVRRYHSVIWLCCTVWPLKMRLYKLLKSSSRTLVCWEFYIAIFKISKKPIKCVSQCQSLGILVAYIMLILISVINLSHSWCCMFGRLLIFLAFLPLFSSVAVTSQWYSQQLFTFRLCGEGSTRRAESPPRKEEW